MHLSQRVTARVDIERGNVAGGMLDPSANNLPLEPLTGNNEEPSSCCPADSDSPDAERHTSCH